ncbi:trypsin-like serine peptidase [Kitasatospora sp. NPDC056138]|uniref:trypsin-like serine peptidase n=1 Tax=Kitasatospora sp. NPDC056138 TaxID=3345724 RepID=UPI0035DB3826
MNTTTNAVSTRRRAGLTATVATALALTATACGPGDKGDSSSQAAAPSSATAAAGAGKGGLDLAKALQNLKNWSADDWAKWAQSHGFKPEAIKGFWDQAKMEAAKGMENQEAGIQSSRTAPENDPQPTVIQAKPQAHPYTPGTAVLGKIFMTVSADEAAVCSGTVISDPAHPGKSNLVWTAAHCLHGGKGADWFKKISFVPSYNRSGAASNGRHGTEQQAAPYGVWDADYAVVSPQWAEEGGERGGPVSQYDFGVIRVHNEDGGGRSLEETVGSSVPVWFNAPRNQIAGVSAYGYPQAAPFDGRELEHCDSAVPPARLSFDASRPTMYNIGCTMTGGASGGGWFVTRNGKPALISENSIGPRPAGWMAGPSLGDEAQSVFNFISRKQD